MKPVYHDSSPEKTERPEMIFDDLGQGVVGTLLQGAGVWVLTALHCCVLGLPGYTQGTVCRGTGSTNGPWCCGVGSAGQMLREHRRGT